MYRRPGRGRLVLLLFLALSIFVITLDFRQNPGGPLKRARDLAVAVVAPIQRGFTTVTRPVGDFFSSLGDLGDTRRQNELLRDRLERVEQRFEEAQTLENENERLRKEMKLEENWVTMEKVHAEVFSSSPANYQWAVEIDAGRAEGIKPDMAVINPQGLVGKTIDVTEHTSTVLLLIDPHAGAGVRIKGIDDTGTVTGNGESQNLTIDFIDTKKRIREGSEVKTSGYDQGIFPAGILVGSVAEVAREDASVQREVEVAPSVNFKRLDFVLVLLETGPRLDEFERPKTAQGGRR